MVPGLAVRSYAEPAAAALRSAGIDADLLPAPTWHGVPADVNAYGRWAAGKIEDIGDVELLIGMSLGTQAAAAAALAVGVPRLLLISPTVDPAHRSRWQLVRTWLKGDKHPDSQSMRSQVPDWRRAGVRRIYTGMASALHTPLEDVLPRITTRLTIVHAGWDNLGSFHYAAALAELGSGEVIELPAAPHSWPIGDTDRFVALVQRLLAQPADAEASPTDLAD